MREEQILKAAIAMRAAYAGHCGDKPIPWKDAGEAQKEAWLLCAEVAAEVPLRHDA